MLNIILKRGGGEGVAEIGGTPDGGAVAQLIMGRRIPRSASITAAVPEVLMPLCLWFALATTSPPPYVVTVYLTGTGLRGFSHLPQWCITLLYTGLQCTFVYLRVHFQRRYHTAVPELTVLDTLD